jgi:tetratricopeptide (TPR) repeat protein
MNKLFFDKVHAVVMTVLLMVFSTGGFAAGGNYSSDVDLDPIIEMIERGDFETAINQLHDILDLDPDNPDIMSLLGYSYRKTRNYEDAQTFYEWALRVEPEHVGANEYLGELYLETNRLDKAVEQLHYNICRTNCKEYSKLKEMIDSFQDTASNS